MHKAQKEQETASANARPVPSKQRILAAPVVNKQKQLLSGIVKRKRYFFSLQFRLKDKLCLT